MSKTKSFTDTELHDLILSMIPKARPYHPASRAFGLLSEAEIKQALDRLFEKTGTYKHWMVNGKEYSIRIKSPSQWRGDVRYKLLVEPVRRSP